MYNVVEWVYVCMRGVYVYVRDVCEELGVCMCEELGVCMC